MRAVELYHLQTVRLVYSEGECNTPVYIMLTLGEHRAQNKLPLSKLLHKVIYTNIRRTSSCGNVQRYSFLYLLFFSFPFYECVQTDVSTTSAFIAHVQVKHYLTDTQKCSYFCMSVNKMGVKISILYFP